MLQMMPSINRGKSPLFPPSFTELKITQTIKELLLGKDSLQGFKFYLLCLQGALPILIFQGHVTGLKQGVF